MQHASAIKKGPKRIWLVLDAMSELANLDTAPSGWGTRYTSLEMTASYLALIALVQVISYETYEIVETVRSMPSTFCVTHLFV